MNGKIFFSFALYAVFFQSAFCGKIIENIKEDVHQAGENMDCAFRDIGNFLGISKRGPCENSTQKKVNVVENELLGNTDNEKNFGHSGFKDFNTHLSETGNPVPSGGTSGVHNKNSKIQGLTDRKIEYGSYSTTEPSAISSTGRLEMSGRRIISAHSNCPPGYIADSRGRCRETF